MAANFASGVGPCAGIVEPFKQVLRVTTHPQILALEQAHWSPTCTCILLDYMALNPLSNTIPLCDTTLYTSQMIYHRGGRA